MSDIHCYDNNLGVDGPAYQRMIAQNNEIKLMKDSEDILDAVLADVELQQVDFLLICGDLTREGEMESHQLVVAKLETLVKRGIPVFVINGNHDINNHRARKYVEDKEIVIPSITGSQFSELYSAFGFGQAIHRDPHSLSYAVQPVPGLWLLALDSCLWEKGFKVEGLFSRQTLAWIEQVLEDAKRQGIPVIGMMHHGVLEHFRENAKYYSDYIVTDFQKVSRLFAKHGLSIVFSGHFHCQDVAFQQFTETDFLYDIETGSLVTYPCPYRMIHMEGEVMEVKSKRITETAQHGGAFASYAYESSYNLAALAVAKTLVRWRVPARDVERLVPQIVRAFQVHCEGNEEAAPTAEVIDLAGVGRWGRFILTLKKPLLESLWKALPPPDNQLVINLRTGNYSGIDG